MSGKPIPTVTPENREYWEGTSLGELRLRWCLRCGAAFRFNTTWCPKCGGQDSEWRPASGQGVVAAFSIISQAPYEAFADSIPYVLALIELTEGVTMMANIIESRLEAVRIGARVSLTFEAREGFHLPQFRLD